MNSVPGEKRPLSRRRKFPERAIYGAVSLAIALLLVMGLGIYFWPKEKSLPSVLVLPLDNLTPDKENDYLTEGITDVLIHTLGKIEGLNVPSRKSAYAIKNGTGSIEEHAARLNMRTILEGGVSKANGKLKINVRLRKVSKASPFWSYEKGLNDVLAVQDDIIRGVVQGLEMTLPADTSLRITKRHTDDAEIQKLYYRGQFHWNKRDADNLQKAIEVFEQAIEKEPSYAPAHAGLADCYLLMPYYAGMPSKDAYPRAKGAAERALQLDKTMGEAWATLAVVKSEFEWKWDEAEEDFRKAIQLHPGYATGHQWFAELLTRRGKHDLALTQIRQACQSDPFSPLMNTIFASVLYNARKYDQAIQQINSTLQLEEGRNFGVAYTVLGLAHLQKGQHEEAIGALTRARDLLKRSPKTLGDLGHAYAIAGQAEKATEMLNELQEFHNRGYGSPSDMAKIYIGMDSIDIAFEWLESCFQNRDFFLVYLKIDPRFDGVRSDPRFVQLVKKVGLE